MRRAGHRRLSQQLLLHARRRRRRPPWRSPFSQSNAVGSDRDAVPGADAAMAVDPRAQHLTPSLPEREHRRLPAGRRPRSSRTARRAVSRRLPRSTEIVGDLPVRPALEQRRQQELRLVVVEAAARPPSASADGVSPSAPPASLDSSRPTGPRNHRTRTSSSVIRCAIRAAIIVSSRRTASCSSSLPAGEERAGGGKNDAQEQILQMRCPERRRTPTVRVGGSLFSPRASAI